MKKKTVKKILAFLVIMALSGGTLIGCGNASDSPEDNTPDPPSQETSSEADTAPAETSAETPDENKVKITVFRNTFNLPKPDSTEVEIVQNAINEYISDKINVEIELHDLANSEYEDKTNLAMASGEVNILWTASWMNALKCDNLVAQNALYDITELLPGTTLYGAMPEWVWKASAYEGKDYFVSCYKESAEGYDLMFRKDLADKYGWDVENITSLQDLEPMLNDCVSEGIPYPYMTQNAPMFYKWYLDDYDFVLQNSMIAVDRDTDSVVNILNSNDYKDFVTLMGEWALKGFISEDDLGKNTPDNTTSTQKWGISWWTETPNNNEAASRYSQDVLLVPYTERWSHSTTTLGSCYGISASSTEEEAMACIDFLGLLYTDTTLADLYTFGIEGVDYDRVDGFIVKKGEKYNHSAWESSSVTALSLEQGEPENKIQLYEDFNNGAKASCASGFRFDFSPVEAEWAACSNLYDMYGYVLENGGYAPDQIEDTLAKFQAELDAAGFQTVLAEVEKQYEAWKATN